MKSNFTALLILAFCVAVVAFAFPQRTFAAGDTLDVPTLVNGNPVGAINITIVGDTNAQGGPLNPNRVYRLARNSVYYANGTMPLRRNVIIIAAPGTTKPPVICPAILQDGSTAPSPLFQFYKNATLVGLYITRIRPDTSNPQGDYTQAIQVLGDSTRLYVKGCVFDGYGQGAVFKGSKWGKFYMFDNEFRNFMNGGGSWFGGFCFESGATPGDTVVMVNNTMFNCGSYLFCPNRNFWSYCRVEHNTVFTNHVNPLFAPYFLNGVIRDNIFWGTLAMGQAPAEITGGWFDWKGAPSSTVSIDTVSGSVDTLFSFAELQRKVGVTNNVYFWPTAYSTAWHTVYLDTLTPPVWMNARTQGMFADKTHWPGLVTDNVTNKNVDPGFNATLVNTVVTNLLAYCKRNRGDATSPNQHYYLPAGTSLFAGDPSFPWPLPENLAYSSTALQTGGHDGFPVGDLNWFPTAKAAWLLTSVSPEPGPGVATKFELSQNYPNPFNPSTKINYTLGQSGKVSLRIYSITGQLVETLLDGVDQSRGTYTQEVNMNRHASGAYFYVLQQGANRQARMMMLLK